MRGCSQQERIPVLKQSSGERIQGASGFPQRAECTSGLQNPTARARRRP